MEALVPLTAVEPLQPAFSSRPGPACGSSARAFQLDITGKSISITDSTTPDPVTASRQSSSALSTHPSRDAQTGSTCALSELLMYYQNVGGINSCLSDYKLACSDACYDIYAFTETWLNGNTASNQLFDDNYVVYRQDRSPTNSDKRCGGGVLLAIRACINSRQVFPPNTSAVEELWVAVSISGVRTFIGIVYLPPDRVNVTDVIETHINSLEWIVSQLSARDNIIIIGDFNLRGISWQYNSNGFFYPDVTRSGSSFTCGCLLDAFSTACLRQLNGVVNENDRLLDLCFVSEELGTLCSIIRAPCSLVKDSRHHPPLQLSLQCDVPSTFVDVCANTVYYDFSKADFAGMNSFLIDVAWVELLRDCDVNLAASTLCNILLYAIDQFVPKTLQKDQVFPVWANSRLKRLKKVKKKALKNFSKVKTASAKARYLKANRVYKSLNKKLYHAHLNRLQRSLKLKPKGFWRYVRDQRKETGLPSIMSKGELEASTTDDIASLFRDQFSGVFLNEPTSQQDIINAAANVPHLPAIGPHHPITTDVVLAATRQLKSSTSSGPDGIPAIILKNCIHAIASPLASIYESSLATGVFPSCWKNSFIFPVHKRGCKRSVSNYRGIAALCASSKLFELIVLDFLSQKCSQYISSDQHGFVPKRSTTTNLVTFTSFVIRQMEKGAQVDAIYTDLSAAFDKMDHEIALAKFDRLGIDGNLHSWLRSYLTNRNMSVKLGDHTSSSFPVKSGVPQGSHLGPFLFLLYMNDVNKVLKCFKKSYADDVKLYYVINTPSDAIFLQEQLEAFATWCDLNRMVLNASKCSVISFGRKRPLALYDYILSGTSLQRENTVKDLGVLLDSSLTFKDQVSYVVSKASSQLGFIFRFGKHFKDVYCLKALYCALVRSTLEYSAVVWAPYYQNGINRIEAVQRKFIRYALRHLPWNDRTNLPSYSDRCRLIHLDSLNARREVAKACFISDLLTSNIDCPELLSQLNVNIRRRALRSHSFLNVARSRTNYGMHEPIKSMCRVFDNYFECFDFNLSRRMIKDNFVRALTV